MKLPADITIDSEKITKYLLLKREKNDKSLFLLQAGYDLTNWQYLETDLRNLTANNEALYSHSSIFGDYYEIKGSLKGPNGKALSVRTIWMKEHFSDQTKFVTLIPA